MSLGSRTWRTVAIWAHEECQLGQLRMSIPAVYAIWSDPKPPTSDLILL